MEHLELDLFAPDEADDAADTTQAEEARTVESALTLAVGRYRQLVASQHGLVPEMVAGDTIEAIDASADTARQAYETISRRIAEAHEARIPVGNPARSAGDAGAAALKPEAKIALGLRKF